MNATDPTSLIQWDVDTDAIVHLVLDRQGSKANTMGADFLFALEATLDRLHTEKAALKGVVVRSAKRSFVAGGDLREMVTAKPEQAASWHDESRRIKAALRRLETSGLPVAAVLAGPALGGGLELALACHFRVAVDAPNVILGFPEVTLGLLPGAGGIVRSVRLLGANTALDSLLLRGQSHSAASAAALKLVDELAPDAQSALDRAREWILTGPSAVQPWDAPDYAVPGGLPATPQVTAALQNRLRGANFPAPRAILSAAIEGLQVDFATAEKIEQRYFVELVVGQVSTNMTQAFFFDRQTTTKRPRPQSHRTRVFEKVAVLGAGMMGAGIAYSCASAGISVVLVDTSQENADRGKAYSEKVLTRAGATDAERAEILGRITATADFSDAAGADVVIEAVFEDPAAKVAAFKNVAPFIAADALLASNTSTLPISDLAEGVDRPADFLGMHFFSPVDRMELVEVIRGRSTTDETVWRALDLVSQIRKVPIVVTDSRGFFTSRTYTAFTYEGIAMVGEGVPAATIEQAAVQAGFPAPILQMMDEVTLTLNRDIREAARTALEEAGQTWRPHPADAVIDTMIDDHGRVGRRTGGAFYEFDEENKRVGLWPGLAEVFGGRTQIPFRDAQDRLLFIGALNGIRALEEGILSSVADANIGSILGIGFPGWTGGVLQFVNGYPGGIDAFVIRCKYLANEYGDRFAPPALLLQKAQDKQLFLDDRPNSGA